MKKTSSAVFLDRDGVINRTRVCEGKPYPPRSLAEIDILPGVPEALTSLHHAGFFLIVITNQPDVARGQVSREQVEAINRYLTGHLKIDAIYTCYHDHHENCDCRKPRPGSILAAARKYHIDLGKSYMIGDRWRDMEAGRKAGCKTIFIDYGYQEQQPEIVDHRVDSLKGASAIILGAIK